MTYYFQTQPIFLVLFDKSINCRLVGNSYKFFSSVLMKKFAAVWFLDLKTKKKYDWYCCSIHRKLSKNCLNGWQQLATI